MNANLVNNFAAYLDSLKVDIQLTRTSDRYWMVDVRDQFGQLHRGEEETLYGAIQIAVESCANATDPRLHEPKVD